MTYNDLKADCKRLTAKLRQESGPTCRNKFVVSRSAHKPDIAISVKPKFGVMTSLILLGEGTPLECYKIAVKYIIDCKLKLPTSSSI